MKNTPVTTSKGFSLIEVMISLVLISIIVGAVLRQIETVQVNSRAEQVKVDIFQDAREFADQIMRDLHQAGYPNARMFSDSTLTYSSNSVAAGIILIAPGELKFEGDVDGTGNISVVDYQLVSSGNNCPCLQRSQGTKPSSGTLSNVLQNVSSAGTSADPIFVGYDSSGTSITSADTTTGLNSLARIKTVQWQIKVKSPILDTQTHQAPETTLHGQALIVNCSLAAISQGNSCF